jgi:hypothetical protein
MARVRLALIGMVSIALLGVLLPLRWGAAHGAAHSGNGDGQRAPVLVELFTSEGCSDCPPADALLERLDRSQPVSDAELFVLSEHVDYWDGIGWRDPYSSHEYTERQGAYAVQFGLGSVYTPQMVVDGRFQLVGSDERGAISAIEIATKAEKIPVSVSLVRWESDRMATLHVSAGQVPHSILATSLEVLIAAADESDESHVEHGENEGRTLKHVAVLRSLTRVGSIDRSREFSQDVKVKLHRGGKGGNLRIVAIVQEAPAGRVLGVGSARLSN